MNVKLAATLSVLRAVLAAMGGFAVGKGWLEQGAVEQITAGVLMIFPAVWGAINATRKEG